MTTLTNEQIVAELGWTRAAIKAVIGVTPIYMRPPYGDIGKSILNIDNPCLNDDLQMIVFAPSVLLWVSFPSSGHELMLRVLSTLMV